MWTDIGRIFVQRKVRIGTIPELYLREVRIPTLSADFRGILLILLALPLAQSRNQLDKVRMALVKKAGLAQSRNKLDKMRTA